MQSDEKAKALHAVFKEMLGVDISNALMPNLPPIDIKPPNQHATKAEFTFELNIVEKSLEHAHALLDHMLGDSGAPPGTN